MCVCGNSLGALAFHGGDFKYGNIICIYVYFLLLDFSSGGGDFMGKETHHLPLPPSLSYASVMEGSAETRILFITKALV